MVKQSKKIVSSSSESSDSDAEPVKKRGRKRVRTKLVQRRKSRVVRKDRNKEDSDRDEMEPTDLKHDEVVRLVEVKGVKVWLGDGGRYVYNDDGQRVGLRYRNTVHYYIDAPKVALENMEREKRRARLEMAGLGL